MKQTRELIVIVMTLTGVAVMAIAAARDEVVFEKPLADGRRVVVTRREVAPGTLPANALVPEHYYRYSFTVVANDGSDAKELCWRYHSDYGSRNFIGTDGVLHVLDVAVWSDVVAVVCRADPFALADVVAPDGAGRRDSLPREKVLFRETFGFATQATFEGSPATDDLTVTVILEDSKRRRFRLVREAGHYEWLEEVVAQSATRPTSQPAVGKGAMVK